MCDKYLLTYYKDEILDILKDPDEHKHFSLNLNFVEMSANDPNLVISFLREPEKVLEEWIIAFKKVQSKLLLQLKNDYIIKNNVHCRIFSLPTYPDFHRTKFPQNNDVNKFLQVIGTVVRMTGMKMLEYQRQYICTKCKYTMLVTAEYEMRNAILLPKKCTNPEDCKGTNIVNLGELNPEFCKDYQEIKIQETVNKLDVGSMPGSIWVTLEDDLVDSCKPGDNITVCGLVKRRTSQLIPGKYMDIELVIKANSIYVNNNHSSILSMNLDNDMFEAFWKTYSDKPLVARDIILKSICPDLYSLFLVKLAVAVVLAGGSSQNANLDTGVKVRSESHLLLVGDPGTGKSQILRFASKIIPRSVLTTGVGSTAAGLTVTAVKEKGEWQLEGGALVMADGGICCIDEFNTMKEHDRTSIHEAMEQQTISVAKAGIVCKLSTRCSILAATNPKGNLDPSQPLSMNVALASPLLSRFDLILLIKDKVDEDWDSQLVDYIFNLEEDTPSSKFSDSINWTIETLQVYFAIIKKNHPMLNEDSHRILKGYYQAQRQKKIRNKSRTTVRLLDSLVRLSQGHARLMFHKEVEIIDAIMAVVLVETAMENDYSDFALNLDTRADFPFDPEGNYQELVEIVLKKLHLDDLLEKELTAITHRGRSSRPGTFPKLDNSNNIKSLVRSDLTKTLEKEIKDLKENDLEADGRENIFEENVHKIDDSEVLESRQEINKSHNLEENIFDLDEVETGIGRKVSKSNADSKNYAEENICESEESKTEIQKKKRNKSSSNTTSKRIKLKSLENRINDDLAALNAIPSVNDIFRMEEMDEEGIGLNIETMNLEEDYKSDEENAESKVLTQGKRTNFLNKFRFVPKDNQLNQSNVDTSGHLDISFRDIKSSTMIEPDKKSTKKFSLENVEEGNSIFESQEELDNLNFDI